LFFGTDESCTLIPGTHIKARHHSGSQYTKTFVVYYKFFF